MARPTGVRREVLDRADAMCVAMLRLDALTRRLAGEERALCEQVAADCGRVTEWLCTWGRQADGEVPPEQMQLLDEGMAA